MTPPVSPHVVLVATYECGHQPFGLASPAAWLTEAGARVSCLDLTRDPLDRELIAAADLVAFHLPMHTATRLAVQAVPEVRRINPRAELCFFGLYAPPNADLLDSLGAVAVIGGEFEAELARLVEAKARRTHRTVVSLSRQRFRVPDRSGLPDLARYAQVRLADGSTRVAGYTEASRGCRHRCRHCPVVPVYDGRFRVVQPEIVLADIDQQVEAGARHVTFGDPDFWNGATHAMRVVDALHSRHPDLTYDVTIKVEHLLAHRHHLPDLAATGCLFVTTAVESFDDDVLTRLDKGHTAADFAEALTLLRRHAVTVNPTFMPFHPWTTPDGYRAFLEQIVAHDLVGAVAPVQLALRLLLPAGSLLLDNPDVGAVIGPFDRDGLAWPWRHPDPAVDDLQKRVMNVVTEGEARKAKRPEIFAAVWAAAGLGVLPRPTGGPAADVPHLLEPWFCCAEPPAVRLGDAALTSI